jgi:integrase
MARSNKKDMFDLTPVITDTSIKVDKVTISHEKSGSSKIRFTYQSKPYSHGVGRLDNDLYRDKVISICKSITVDLRLGKFDPDNWKMIYFGIDQTSKVINFPYPQNTVSKSLPVKSELTLIDIWENYLKVKGDRLTYNTLNGTINAASNHIDYAVSIDCDCVYLDNIEQFVNILKSKYADSTLLSDFSYYNTACDLAMKQGKITGNPFTVYLDAFFGKKQKNKSILCYTESDIKVILDTLRNCPYLIKNGSKKVCDDVTIEGNFKDSKERAAYIADLVEFKFLTGMRPGEIHALKWTDLKLTNQRPEIIIQRVVSINGKDIKDYLKNGSDFRVFPINSKLMNVIDRLPRIDNPNDLIFPSYSNNGYNKSNCYDCPSQVFKCVINGLFDDGLISIPLRYYCTRHTFITLAMRSGKANIATLAKWTGHTTATLMNNYYASENDAVVPDIF